MDAKVGVSLYVKSKRLILMELAPRRLHTLETPCSIRQVASSEQSWAEPRHVPAAEQASEQLARRWGVDANHVQS